MTTQAAPAAPKTPPVRQLWQAPMFLLGVICLAGYLIARPLWLSPERQFEGRLADVRKRLFRPDVDAQRAIETLEKLIAEAPIDSPHLGEAHFLLGTAHLRVARALQVDVARSEWLKAREHLETAASSGVPADDRNALQFRLGVAEFHSGTDRQTVIAHLNAALAVVEECDRSEAYQLLTLANLELPHPDLAAALQANEQLRQLPLLGEDVLAPARVQGGEILMRLRKPAEARALLELVARTAPPAMLARARLLRAQCQQEEGAWAEAAALWQEALADAQNPLDDPALSRYRLGVCLRKLDQPQEAARSLRAAIQSGEGDPAAAAALDLADVLLELDNGAEATETLVHAVQTVRSAGDWKNALIDLADARNRYVQACSRLAAKGDHERAMQVAQLYERLAVNGDAKVLQGQAAEDWAKALRERATKPEASANARQDMTQAQSLSLQAGRNFEEAAGLTQDAKEQTERLWYAAGSYLRAGDADRSVTMLKQYLRRDGLAEARKCEAWYLLAEAQRWRKDDKAAEAAYRECLVFRSKFAYRARYQIGQIELHRGNTDTAVEMLEQNVKLLRLDPDDESLERSLYSLGGLLAGRKDHTTARFYLEEAVSKFPQSSFAVRGRLDLAETYRNLADQENQNALQPSDAAGQTREHHQKQYQMWLTKAAEEFEFLAGTLSAGGATSTLTPTEQVHVLFTAADCRFWLAQWEVALRLYEQLAVRFKDRPERLRALGGSARCSVRMGQTEKFEARLTEIRAQLHLLDDATRRRWEEWLLLAGGSAKPKTSDDE